MFIEVEKWSPKTKVSSSLQTTTSLSFPLRFAIFFIYFYFLIFEYAWNLIVQWCNMRFNKKKSFSWMVICYDKRCWWQKNTARCARNSTFYFQGLQEHAAYQNILSRRRKRSIVLISFHQTLITICCRVS